MKHVGGRNVTLVIVIVFQNQPPKQEQSSIVNFQVLYTFILHVD